MTKNKYEQMVGKEWASKLGPFFDSSEFRNIGKILKHLTDNGTEVFPSYSDIFNAFRLCDFNSVKVVFLTSNCLVEGEGNGLAFSYKKECEKTPIGEKILDALADDLDEVVYRDYDLSDWAKQGVLLLNVDLSTVKGKFGSHIELWKPFTKYVMEQLSLYQTGVIYVLIGKEAHKYKDLINNKSNDIYLLEHPMIAVAKKRRWEHQNIFETINRITPFLHSFTINWVGNLTSKT